MPPDALISAKSAPKCVGGRAAPGPAESQRSPRPSSWIQGVLDAPNFVYRFGGQKPLGLGVYTKQCRFSGIYVVALTSVEMFGQTLK